MANEIEHFRGDHKSIPFIMERPVAGSSSIWEPVNLSGARIRFTVKRRLSDPLTSALIVKDSAAAGVVIRDQTVPENLGIFDVILAPEDTEAILPTGTAPSLTAWYDVEVTELNGTKTTLIRAPFVLLFDVTAAV